MIGTVTFHHRDYREYAQGVGWKALQIREIGSQQVSPASLPIPDYREPALMFRMTGYSDRIAIIGWDRSAINEAALLF
jgi:hypothetical protein